MKAVRNIFFIFFILIIAGCGTVIPKKKKTTPISKTNQAPTEPKFVKKTDTKREVLPDGTVVVTEMTIYEDADGKAVTSVNRHQDYDGESGINVPDTPPTTPTSTTPGMPSTRFETVSRVPSSTLPKPKGDAAPTITTRSIDTAQDAKFMSQRAREMVKEINLLRTNPRAYVQEVQAYRERIKNTEYSDLNYAKEQLRATDDLIRELQIMSPMASLQPRLTLHKTAQKHGVEILANDAPTHVGLDGSYPWDRITRDDLTLEDGNENLVGGPSDIKELLMLLLVDAGVPGYGHRRALLNPTWKYVACYEIGTVANTPNYWIQCFAK